MSKINFLQKFRYKLYTHEGCKEYERLKQLIRFSRFKSVEIFSLTRHLFTSIIFAVGIPIINTNNTIYINTILSKYTEDYQQIILSAANDLKNITDIGLMGTDVYESALQVNLINNNISNYLFLLLVCFLAYNLPVYILQMKKFLLNSKKDWEIVNLITVASIDSSNKVETVVSSLISASYVYNDVICEFKDILDNNLNFAELLDNIDDDSLRELLETLIICKDIGLDNSKENINELLDFKLKYMDIIAKKKRSFKATISLVPISIILVMLFNYLMLGLNSITQNLFTNI